jgi:quercetin dioxygenase-like cupin family protein
MQYVRAYADAAGESHFEDVVVSLALVDFAPPAPPLSLSPLSPAARYGFLAIQPGWSGDWHPAPQRQLIFYLAGEVEFEVSGGEVRRFGPGSVVLLEDTTGKGHRTRNAGTGDVAMAVVQLPD